MNQKKTEIPENPELKKYKNLILSVFSNPKGEELLEWWTRNMVFVSSYNPTHQPTDTAFNEGRKSIVIEILNHLEESRK